MKTSTVESVKNDSRVNGTSLRGYLDARYSELVELFGPPLVDGDGYKVDAEWNLVFNDETMVTIYNYKTGKNYRKANGLNVEDIEVWHVGGKSISAVFALDDYFEENGSNLSVRLR